MPPVLRLPDVIGESSLMVQIRDVERTVRGGVNWLN